ncbi:MAG: glycosyltransferase [Anaerolineae bacterium]|nr:glycosyltransferase [Anaerolineae bacterium]
MTNPKVSVLMAVYNGERYLQAALDSILNQTFSDFELVIIDDASTDDTAAILAACAAQDARIRLVPNEHNLGLTRSLNKGLHLACGDYIARQDADDVSMPDRLAKQVTALDTQADTILVTGHLDLIDEQGEVWRRPRWGGSPPVVAWHLLFYNYVGGHSQVMFRRRSILDLGGYNEQWRYSQDYELWCRVVHVGDIAFLPDVLLQWRRHSSSITGQKKLEQEAYSLMVSGRAQSDLTATPLTIGDMAALRSFWLRSFPGTDRAAWIHEHLRVLHHAFLERYETDRPTLAVELEDLIGQRFFVWALVTLKSGHLLRALNLFILAGYWQSLPQLARQWRQQIRSKVPHEH